MKRIFITGSSGLNNSNVCIYFASVCWEIHGVDNNQGGAFLGPSSYIRWSEDRLEKSIENFVQHELDIWNRQQIIDFIASVQPESIVHIAAQPSHGTAAATSFHDFDLNAVGTFNISESTRRFNKNTRFVLMSVNKVYGDAPNRIARTETRQN